MDSLIVCIILGFLAIFIVIYNRLVRDHNRVLAAWSDIDVQLKRRHDLIPKLIDIVKKYAEYEQATLITLTELRQQANQTHEPVKLGPLESRLGQRLHRFVAVAEDYPNLKANELFLQLQQDLSDVENHIQFARRYYNGSVRNLNTRIESFPDLIIARLFRYRPAQLFELNDSNQSR